MRPDLTGQKFGKWTAMSPTIKDRRRAWLCKCECGTEREVREHNLTAGLTTSCGQCITRGPVTYLHGRSKEPAYQNWKAARRRCNDVNHKDYYNYGGRGITFCDRWDEPHGQGYLNFLEDMGNRPEGTSIDRIDPDGNYEPGNCRWATPLEQSRNQRRYNTPQ